jgi:hypothetical protein
MVAVERLGITIIQGEHVTAAGPELPHRLARLPTDRIEWQVCRRLWQL